MLLLFMEHFLCINIEEEEKQRQYLIKKSHGLEKIRQHTSCTKITPTKWTLGRNIHTLSTKYHILFLDKNKQYVNVKNYYCYILLRIYIYPVKITVKWECHFILMIISPIHTLKKDHEWRAKQFQDQGEMLLTFFAIKFVYSENFCPSKSF